MNDNHNMPRTSHRGLIILILVAILGAAVFFAVNAFVKKSANPAGGSRNTETFAENENSNKQRITGGIESVELPASMQRIKENYQPSAENQHGSTYELEYSFTGTKAEVSAELKEKLEQQEFTITYYEEGVAVLGDTSELHLNFYFYDDRIVLRVT